MQAKRSAVGLWFLIFENLGCEYHFTYQACLRATCLPRCGAGTAHRQVIHNNHFN